MPDSMKPVPNWLNIPEDVLSMILSKLDAIEILEMVQNVCSLWRKVCKNPVLWRTIDMADSDLLRDLIDTRPNDLLKICKAAVSLSSGRLLAISIRCFATNELLEFISERSHQLRCLRLVCCHTVTGRLLSEAVARFSLLENLEISFCPDPNTIPLDVIGCFCPLLKSLKFNNIDGTRITQPADYNKDALAIGRTMPNLIHLQIFRNMLTNIGLRAILEGCPKLESLDLRQCYNVNLEGNSGIKVPKRIKNLWRPCDSIDDDFEFVADDYSSDYNYDTNYEEVLAGLDDYDPLFFHGAYD